jgi:hypothetical protein
MNEIHTRILVGPDRRIVGTAPVALPPGEHDVTITLTAEAVRIKAVQKFDVAALPSHDLGPWPPGLRLRREEMYGDDER